MEEKVVIEGKTSKFRGWFFTFFAIMLALDTLFVISSYKDVRRDAYGEYLLDLFILTAIPIFIGCLPYIFGMHKAKIVVTDKRIYGCAIFRKRVDLPIDSITAVGTSAFKGIDVATPSGAIKFKHIKNNEEIHKTISEMIIERQKTEKSAPVIMDMPQSNADELKKFKELLDSGVITQEEFDAKKKQLLGL